MELTATEFKAKCLEVLDTVFRTGETVRITKRGTVVAELRPPYDAKPARSGWGIAKGQMEIRGDLIEPIDVEWEALQ